MQDRLKEEYAATGSSDRRERQTPPPVDQAATHAPIDFQHRSKPVQVDFNHVLNRVACESWCLEQIHTGI
ncbi:MAG: hypothetical protein IPP82_14940 [Xanthomonadales bacterium]|nr:hypothetical protein [Xanthomonadales bacterium]